MEFGMRSFAAFVLAFSACLMVGCGGETDGKKDKKSAHNHDHDHGDHGSSDHIGAASAHKIELKDAPFNAKWEHAGDLVTIKICDNDYKEAVEIAAKEILISDTGDKNVFKLPAIKKNDKGEASVFELADEKLEMLMDHKPTLTVKVGDKEYKTTVIHIH